MQDFVPTLDSVAQSPNLTLLDGIQPNNPNQSTNAIRSSYSDTVKHGLGAHGGNSKPPTQPEPIDKHRFGEPPRVLLSRESSIKANHSAFDNTPPRFDNARPKHPNAG